MRSATAPLVGQGRIQRAGQLDGGGQRPRAAQADLERALVPGKDLLDRVEVGGHHAARGPHVTARPLRDAPAARRRLHRHVDQERRGPADQIGAGPAGGKFGQVGEVRQLAGHDPGRLRRVRSRHGTDAGGAPGQPRERPRAARVTERVILHDAELRASRCTALLPRSADGPRAPGRAARAPIRRRGMAPGNGPAHVAPAQSAEPGPRPCPGPPLTRTWDPGRPRGGRGVSLPVGAHTMVIRTPNAIPMRKMTLMRTTATTTPAMTASRRRRRRSLGRRRLRIRPAPSRGPR